MRDGTDTRVERTRIAGDSIETVLGTYLTRVACERCDVGAPCRECVAASEERALLRGGISHG